MRSLLAFSVAFVIAGSAQAQFGGFDLGKAVNNVSDLGKIAKGATGIGPEEERTIGGSVAIEIASKYGGILHDEAISRRVNLVGKSLARYSSRPDLQWRFGVLGSQTVNAFSAPGGYVFITRGLYDMLPTDDALAAVLAHEITHITRRHALNIIARNGAFSGALDLASQKSADVQKFDTGIDQITKTLFETGFDAPKEYEADSGGRQLAITTGYAPGGLRFVLEQLQANGGDPKKVFSTHPPLPERIKRLPADPAPPGDPAAAH